MELFTTETFDKHDNITITIDEKTYIKTFKCK